MSECCLPSAGSDGGTAALERLCHQNEALSEAVSGVVAAMYETGAQAVDLPEAQDPSVLEPAISAGLVTITGRQVAFADSSLRLSMLARFVAESVLLPAWDDRAWFAQAVACVERREREIVDGSGLARDAFVLLHKRYGKDVLRRTADEAAQGPDHFWCLYHTLARALPYLEAAAVELGPALAAIYTAIQADLANHMMHQAVEALSERQPEVGEALFCQFAGGQGGSAAALIPQVLSGLSKVDFAGAHQRALNLSKSKDPVLAGYGISALSVLDYQHPSRAVFLEKTLRRYTVLRRRGSVPAVAAVTYGYGRMLRYSNALGGVLVELSTRSEAEIQFQLSQVLWLDATEYQDEEWFRTALVNLAAVKASDRRTLDAIDDVLRSVADTDPRLACSFLTEWAMSSDYGQEPEHEDFTAVFEGAFSALATQQLVALEECMTTWFAADAVPLHRAATDVVKMLAVRRGSMPEGMARLSGCILDTMSPEHVGFTIRKILGWVPDAESLTTLVFSVLERRPRDALVDDLVVWAFVTYIAYNYPRVAIGFLEKRIASEAETEREVARRALDGAEAYYSALRKLPELRELEPPTQRVRRLQGAKERKLQDTVDAAQEKSVMLQLITRVPLKAGTSFFLQADGAATPRTPLSESEFSADIPRGEQIDPVGQACLRLTWRSETRRAAL